MGGVGSRAVIIPFFAGIGIGIEITALRVGIGIAGSGSSIGANSRDGFRSNGGFRSQRHWLKIVVFPHFFQPLAMIIGSSTGFGSTGSI